MKKSIINLIFALLVPIASIIFIYEKPSREKSILALIILTITFITVIASHSDELLSIKKKIAIMFVIIYCLGFIILIIGSSSLYFIAYSIIAGTGMITIFIPGVFRFILSLIGKFRRSKDANNLEGTSLFYIRIPWQINEVGSALKYSIYNNPWRNRIKSVISGQFIISLLYSIVRLSKNLEEVTIVREYNLKEMRPQILLSRFERVIYSIVFLFLILMNKI
jgi:hypothetical protein